LKTSINNLPFQRPTWAEINLDALHANTLKIAELVSPARIMAVIKADGYGHGALAMAREFENAGVAYFGTATVEEALEIRQAGLSTPILVLGGMTLDQLPLLRNYEFSPTIHNREFYDSLANYVANSGMIIPVHLKVDTGMGRLGMTEQEAADIIQNQVPEIRIQGLFTHFACADTPNDESMHMQISRFNEFLKKYGEGIPDIHAANSAAILNYPESHYNLVRPGLLLYGLSPCSGNPDLEPILSIKSRIIAIRKIQAGQSIGYGRTFVANRESLIATVPIGYSDGLRRRLSNKLKVDVKGTMCPIVGTISMDLCMLDVTDHPDVQLYDVVTFLGPGNGAWEWARMLDTIPWEILCLIGSRVQRVYYKEGKICDVYYP
jgi:alanine racemase